MGLLKTEGYPCSCFIHDIDFCHSMSDAIVLFVHNAAVFVLFFHTRKHQTWLFALSHHVAFVLRFELLQHTLRHSFKSPRNMNNVLSIIIWPCWFSLFFCSWGAKVTLYIRYIENLRKGKDREYARFAYAYPFFLALLAFSNVSRWAKKRKL